MIEDVKSGHVFKSPLTCMRVKKLSIDELCKQLMIGVKLRLSEAPIMNNFVAATLKNMEPDLREIFLQDILEDQIKTVRTVAAFELIKEYGNEIPKEKVAEYFGYTEGTLRTVACEAVAELRKNIMTCKAGLETRESLREAAGGARLKKKKPI